MRIQQSSSSTSNSASAPGRGGSPISQEEAPKALNSFQRVPSSAVMSKALRALTSTVDPESVEGQIQALFIEQFSAKAQDHAAFHAFMKQVFGEDYHFIKAEAYRRNALAGDFSWLPPIQFISDEELMGANGACCAQSGVVYLNEALRGDLELAASTFVEEAGHHLDAMLNETDSAGDEGELFRRLAANEALSACVESPDDQYEPNDSREEATRIDFDTSLKARSYESNPDFFILRIDSPMTLSVAINTRGDEVYRAYFAVYNVQGDPLYSQRPSHRAPGVINPHKRYGTYGEEAWEISVPAEEPGDYIIESP